MRRLPGVTRHSNRVRNVIIALCMLVALLGGLLVAAQALLGGEYLRAAIVARVEAATGKPCALESASIALFPSPRVELNRFHLGQTAATINFARATATLSGAALLGGRIEVPEITVEGLGIMISEGVPVWAAIEGPGNVSSDGSDGPKDLGITIGAVNVPNWRVARLEEVLAEGSLKVQDPLGANASFNGAATLPGLSPGATASVDGAITRGEGAFALSGKAALKDADLAQAAGREEIKSAVLNAELSFTGASPDDIAFTLDGALSASGAAELAGKVSGKAWWKDGTFTANDFTWDSPGLHLVADATRKSDGELAVNVREADAEGDGLSLLLGLGSTDALRVSARKEAKLEVQDLLVGRTPEGQFRWVKGEARLSGIDADGKQGPLADNIKAHCLLEEGTLRIVEASTGGLTISGTLVPAENAGMTFDLKGAGELSSPIIAAALPPSIAKGAKGKLTLKRMSGTWMPGATLPANFAVEGALENGALSLRTGRFNDEITGLAVNFATDGKSVFAKAAADSAAMGALKYDGSLDTATQALKGTATFSLNRLAAAFVPAGGGADIARAMLAAYDGASYAISFVPPVDTKTPGSFTLENQGSPPAKVTAALLLDDKRGTTPGAITARLEVPFAPAAAAFPVPASGEGTALVSFERTAEGRFSGSADLTSATLAVPPYLNKRAGSAVRLDIAGAAGDTWALESLLLDLLGQPVALTPKGEGLVADDLRFDLARLAPLFPEGSEAAGSLSGTLGTAPLATNLRFTGVRVKTPSGIAIDEINGTLAYAPGALRCEGLHVMAYGSDIVLDGAMKDGRWDGTLRGARADLNTLAALRGATSGSGSSAGGRGEGAAAGGLSGQIAASIDEVVYRRAVINGFKAVIRFSPEEFAVEEIACAPYGGSAQGAFVLRTPGGGSTGTASTQIQFRGVDLKLLDDLSTQSEPRGMYGPASGTIDLRFPVTPEGKPQLGVDGEVVISAENGSLGKAGASGKVLAALRTAELAQLQLPSLRDKGLSFQTMNARVTCDSGVLTVQQFDVAESTHTMTATGVVDYPADAIDVTLRIQLLQNVRNVLGAIPLLDRLAEAGGIYLYFTGPASDPKVSAARIRPLQEIRQGGGGLIQGVKGLLGR